jgi:hypothetical protein
MPNFYNYQANDPTSDSGPSTASILTFSVNTNDSFIKELTQNSLDARLVTSTGKLSLKIRMIEIKKTDIPNFSELESIINQMELYWNLKSDQYKQFFKTAKKSISGESIRVLVFEDFLTKGLTGDDMSKDGTFKSCVNDENTSQKESSNSLGSYGIGKNAVFGYSGIQTVFYSSLNQIGEFKFKGVSKLGTFDDKNGLKRAERLYYGKREGDNSQITLVDRLEEIPKVFQRTESGLSQYVLGVESNDDWINNIKKAFLTTYWFLFESDKLTVDINGEILSKNNYEEEAEMLFKNDQSKENPIPFIKIFKNAAPEKKSIYKIGEVCLFVSEENENENFPNRILFLRDGMKIKLDTLGISGLPINIAGVMFCTDPNGNRILGGMEPHAHDKFQPELVEKKLQDITVTEAKKIIKEIEEFKKEVLLKIKSKYTTESDNIDFVDELFTSILGSGMGGGVGNSIKSNEETFHKRTFEIDYKLEFNSTGRNISKDLNSPTDSGDGDGEGAGLGEGGKGIIGGDRKIKAKGGGSGSENARNQPSANLDLASRFFLSSSSNGQNVYKLILRSEEKENQNYSIVFNQSGDTRGKEGEMSAEVLSITSESRSIEYYPIRNRKDQITAYKISHITICKDSPVVFEIAIREKSLSALQIIQVYNDQD